MPAAPRVSPTDLFTLEQGAPFQARSSWKGPLLVVPYWVNFHAEHHLFMHIPC